MRIKIRFLRGARVIAEVLAPEPLNSKAVTVADMEAIVPTEQLLEKLTGYRVHIEQVHEP